jgi:hypothetical protein
VEAIYKQKEMRNRKRQNSGSRGLPPKGQEFRPSTAHPLVDPHLARQWQVTKTGSPRPGRYSSQFAKAAGMVRHSACGVERKCDTPLAEWSGNATRSLRSGAEMRHVACGVERKCDTCGFFLISSPPVATRRGRNGVGVEVH